jgi:pyruvate dehydrogenase E1 component alpha subunit
MTEPHLRNSKTELGLELFQKMVLIRRMEEALGRIQKTGVLPGPVHLYIGEEAVAAGVCANLSDSDWVTSTHRGHGHFLAKGGEPAAMAAEIYGRTTGICGGKGGSMHVADVSKGILGANGIVAGGIGLAVGAALASQLDGKGGVAVAFFGDGASNQGVLSEALNIAALWKLPLLLICENNGFSEFSPSATVTAGRIADRAKPFGVPSIEVDGNDVFEVWRATGEAARRAREGGGPTLIEAHTYRLCGHVEYEVTFLSEKYRDDRDVEAWKARDPILKLQSILLGEGVSEQRLSELDAAALKTAEEAFKFADASDWPTPERAFSDMFV